MNSDRKCLSAIRDEIMGADRRAALENLFMERRKRIMREIEQPSNTNNSTEESRYTLCRYKRIRGIYDD